MSRCLNHVEQFRCWSILWDCFCIGISLGLVIGSFVLLGWGISVALFNHDLWERYKNSNRLSAIVKWLRDNHIEITKEMIIAALKDPLARLAEGTLNFLEEGVVTCVFLFFLLVGEARSQREQSNDADDVSVVSRGSIRLGISRDVKTTVSTYLFLKSAMSLLLAGCVAIVLSWIGVDLLFVCIVLVFLLNFIPLVGGAMSVLLPCSLCFFDNTKTVTDIAGVFFFPTLLHVFFGYLMEPSLFGNALELHPIIVMFSLMIWTVMWGMVGAILSVPLTCCLKIVLKSMMVKHPYALFGFCALEFRLPNVLELELIKNSSAPTDFVTTSDVLTTRLVSCSGRQDVEAPS
eukprot:GEMP01026698.1.p1 GENE.GEMP01026698.1~~GEMP01026698.1.p1  ORF type:complete len:347 (+),score=32.80 GEMP01026698.1:379-1419(+)